MAVYFKFKSAKDFDSVPIDGHFISVGHLKEKIFESKHLGRGTDFDLIVSNTQTNEEYADEAMLIPKHASVLVRRIPGRPRKPIVTEPNESMYFASRPKMKENNQFEETEMIKNNLPVAESSIVRVSEEAEWDEFGNDLYAIPDMLPQQSSSQLQEAVPPPSRADEDSKIKALIDTSALDWQRQTQEFGSGRGFGRGLGGRMMTGRGFGHGAGPDKGHLLKATFVTDVKCQGTSYSIAQPMVILTMILGRSSHLQEFQNPCWWLPWKDLILCLVVQLLC